MKSNVAKRNIEMHIPTYDSVNSEEDMEENKSINEELKLDDDNELSGLNHEMGEMSPSHIVEAQEDFSKSPDFFQHELTPRQSLDNYETEGNAKEN